MSPCAFEAPLLVALAYIGLLLVAWTNRHVVVAALQLALGGTR